jgi:hypothetical protein
MCINKTLHYWIRVQYNKVYDSPVTSIRVIECDYESPEFLVITNINNLVN